MRGLKLDNVPKLSNIIPKQGGYSDQSDIRVDLTSDKTVLISDRDSEDRENDGQKSRPLVIKKTDSNCFVDEDRLKSKKKVSVPLKDVDDDKKSAVL